MCTAPPYSSLLASCAVVAVLSGCPPAPLTCPPGTQEVEGSCRRPCSADGECDASSICARGYCELGNRRPVPTEAGTEAGRDGAAADRAGLDAARDAGQEAGLDAGADAGRDAGVDAGRDAGVDAGRDAGVDAGRDAAEDAGGDAAPGDLGSVPDALLLDVPSVDQLSLDHPISDTAVQPDFATCGPQGALCDDGDPETFNDLCVLGNCVGYRVAPRCEIACPQSCTVGTCCSGGCDAGDCTCGWGCSCAFEVPTGGTVICEVGTRCHAEGSGSIFFICAEHSSCDLVCSGGAYCIADCMQGAHCLVRCQDTSNCPFRTCVEPVDCDGGVSVCNRACP